MEMHLFDDLLHRHAPILIEVALAMVAERAAAPITATRRQVGNDQLRHEVAVQRQAIEVRQRERGRLFGVDFGIPVNA